MWVIVIAANWPFPNRAGRSTLVHKYRRVHVRLASLSPDERTPIGLATPDNLLHQIDGYPWVHLGGYPGPENLGLLPALLPNSTSDQTPIFTTCVNICQYMETSDCIDKGSSCRLVGCWLSNACRVVGLSYSKYYFIIRICQGAVQNYLHFLLMSWDNVSY